MNRLKGKAALITGGASGIGLATARLFLEEGAKVAIADISAQKGRAALGGLKRLGFDPMFIRADVSKEADVKRMVRMSVDEFGRLDILFNNAGIFVDGRVHDILESEWERIIAVNLKGVFLCSKHAIPQMRKQGGGVIVNSSSCSAVMADYADSAYCASKAGVCGLTRGTAVDYAKENIRVNAVLFGEIETPMTRDEAKLQGVSYEDFCQYVASHYPTGRLGTVEEAAKVVLFLASDDSSLLTGALLSADNGITAAALHEEY